MNNSFVTQSTIGKWFGISSRDVGKILTKQGLKDKDRATEDALRKGFAKEARTRSDVAFPVWDAYKVSVLIDKALGIVEKPYLDSLESQVGEAIIEAERYRADGEAILADLILEQACEGVPPALIRLIRGKLLHQHSQT